MKFHGCYSNGLCCSEPMFQISWNNQCLTIASFLLWCPVNISWAVTVSIVLVGVVLSTQCAPLVHYTPSHCTVHWCQNITFIGCFLTLLVGSYDPQIVSQMTYNVSSGMLNHTIPYHSCIGRVPAPVLVEQLNLNEKAKVLALSTQTNIVLCVR